MEMLIYQSVPCLAKNYFESRIVFPTEWVPDSQKRIQNEQLNKIISEETLWAEEANKTRQKAMEELRIKREQEEEALPIAVAISII